LRELREVDLLGLRLRIPSLRSVIGCIALTFVTFASLAFYPAFGKAAVTLGSSLQADPNDSGSIEATYVQTSLPAGGIVSSPIDGVITRWRMRGFTQGASPAQILFRVMRPAGTDTFTAMSTTSAMLPTSLGTYEFPARVPIQRGDYIGLTQTSGNTIWLDSGFPGAGSLDFFPEAFADNQTQSGSPTPDDVVTINASVEADADHDGFGDETQDRCATNGATQGACAVKKNCKHKKRKHKSAVVAKKCKKKHH
jgi:hypothetical protein